EPPTEITTVSMEDNKTSPYLCLMELLLCCVNHISSIVFHKSMSEAEGMEKRDWKQTNEKIVKRGEVFAKLDWVKTWDEELERMNKGKRGRPYEYPNSLILFACYIYVALGLSWRELEGFISSLMRICGRPSPDYSVLFRRVNALVPEVEKTLARYKGMEVTISVDATGVKVTNRGEWIRKVYRKERRGWVKLHIAVEHENKQIVSVCATEETVADTKKFPEILLNAKNNVERNEGRIIQVNCDGGYDSNVNFETADEFGILPVIRIRAPEKISARSKNPRKKYGRQMKEMGYKCWKDAFGYGKRWYVETAFSVIKRKFGEYVRARKKENMMKEVQLKCFVYNLMVRYDVTGILPWQ
ncbi:MAG: IS5 family transposase, partial [Thermoplasmata archaeon]|nr:IS5 family transposase [Thermoplasmata archaeon]